MVWEPVPLFPISQNAVRPEPCLKWGVTCGQQRAGWEGAEQTPLLWLLTGEHPLKVGRAGDGMGRGCREMVPWFFFGEG